MITYNKQAIMDYNYILFLFMGIIIIVPIIPAYVFFKILPTKKSDVEGTFAGLKFKLGGAFAGYFLIFFVLIMAFNTDLIEIDEENTSWEIWEIEGVVEFEGGVGSTSTLKLIVDPPTFRSFGDKIKLRVLSKPGHNGEMEFPDITVSHENFIPAYIEISEEDSQDEDLKKIVLNDKIVLKKAPQ